MNQAVINDDNFIVLIFSKVKDSNIGVCYGVRGCQDLRRHALYSWMRKAIENNEKENLDFLEIMSSVVKQLEDDGLIVL